jgi:hypothetical protein
MEKRLADDLMIGIPAISEFIGVSPRKGYHLAETGQLRGLFKLGNLWAGRRSTIIQNIAELESAA